MTRRCFVIACRVMSKRSVSFAIDVGPRSPSRDTMPSLVSSPRAKNTAADFAIDPLAATLRRAGKMLLDEPHLRVPAAFVRREGFRTPLEGNPVEARFGHGQKHAVRLLLERELDERGRFLRVVDAGLDGVRMPAEREETLRFDADNGDLERHATVGLLRPGDLGVRFRRHDDATQGSPRHERSVESDAEPFAELPGVGQGLPDTRPRGAQQNVFLDPVGDGHSHMQPPGCASYDIRPSYATSRLLFRRRSR